MARLIFRKMAKALDTTTFEYTAKEQQAEQLIAALEKAKPKKRKKVLPAPNEGSGTSQGGDGETSEEGYPLHSVKGRDNRGG